MCDDTGYVGLSSSLTSSVSVISKAHVLMHLNSVHTFVKKSKTFSFRTSVTSLDTVHCCRLTPTFRMNMLSPY